MDDLFVFSWINTMFLYELLLNWLLMAFLIVIQCAYRDRLRVVWLNLCGLVSDGGLGGGFAALITILWNV